MDDHIKKHSLSKRNGATVKIPAQDVMREK